MANAMFLASVFGPLMFFVGLWMLTHTKNVAKVVAAVRTSLPAMFMTGFINLLLGFAIVNMYNVWASDLTVLVTLLGWVMIVRGLLVFFMPKFVMMMKAKKESSVRLWALLPFVWGFLLCWLAYMS